MERNSKQAAKKYGFRSLMNDVHLWLGIASGIIVFLVCLSGTIYTFHHEVEVFLSKDLYHVEVTTPTAPLTVEQVIANTATETGGVITSVLIPEDAEESYQVSVKSSPEERRGSTYFVNQYTGKVMGKAENVSGDFFMFWFRMHRWLLLDSKIGRPIVGWATVVFCVILITGLVIWFPKKLKNIRQGFKIKFNANWKRINHDLHNTLGFYSFLLLLIMALSGLCWSFGWYREALSGVLGNQVFGGRNEKPMLSTIPEENGYKLTPSDFLAKADDLFDFDGDYNLNLPANDSSAIVIYKYKTGFAAVSSPDKAQFDQYSGELLKLDRFSDKTLGQQISSTIKPIHTGEIFGLFSKIIYFIACLIGTSLPITGVIIWINKLRKKNKKKKQARLQVA